MTVPTWVSWRGLALHLVLGAGIHWGFGHGTSVAVALLAGVFHEQAERTPDGRYFADFRMENGGPYNGALDVLTFMVVPLLAWAWWALTGGVL